MTLQEKIQALFQHYSAEEIAAKLTDRAGRPVPVSTVYAYASGRINSIRIKAVNRAVEELVSTLV